MSVTPIISRDKTSLHDHINQITACWKRTAVDYVGGILEVGQKLIAAQEQYSESLRTMADKLPFDWTTASRLMVIAKVFVVARGQQASLPPSWRTIYELAKLPDHLREAALADGRIHPDLTREEAIALNPQILIDSIRGPRITVPDGKTISEWIRVGLEIEDREGLPPEKVAKKIKFSLTTYHHARDVVLLSDHSDLDKADLAQCRDALKLMDEARVIAKPYSMIKDIVVKVWGKGRNIRHTKATADKRLEQFEHAVTIICQACDANLTVPQLNQAKLKTLRQDLMNAREALTQLINKLREKTQ